MGQAISHTARLGKQHVHKLRRKASLVLIFTLQPCPGALAGVRVFAVFGATGDEGASPALPITQLLLR